MKNPFDNILAKKFKTKKAPFIYGAFYIYVSV